MSPTEHLMDRRRALTLLAGAGLGVVAAACSKSSSNSPAAQSPASPSAAAAGASPSAAAANTAGCILTPELTAGPYYLDVKMVRSDITEGKPGTPLTLALTVVGSNGCSPIKDAAVDIWHADASGVYSGFGGASTGGPAPGGQPAGTDKKTFLRGIQMTDAAGKVEFKTIYPGWYPGRATHIHVKVSTGGNVVHTGQLFFPEDVSQVVYHSGVYASRGTEDTINARDGIFAGGGKQSVLTLTRSGDGYIGSLVMGVKEA